MVHRVIDLTRPEDLDGEILSPFLTHLAGFGLFKLRFDRMCILYLCCVYVCIFMDTTVIFVHL